MKTFMSEQKRFRKTCSANVSQLLVTICNVPKFYLEVRILYQYKLLPSISAPVQVSFIKLAPDVQKSKRC